MFVLFSTNPILLAIIDVSIKIHVFMTSEWAIGKGIYINTGYALRWHVATNQVFLSEDFIFFPVLGQGQ